MLVSRSHTTRREAKRENGAKNGLATGWWTSCLQGFLLETFCTNISLAQRIMKHSEMQTNKKQPKRKSQCLKTASSQAIHLSEEMTWKIVFYSLWQDGIFCETSRNRQKENRTKNHCFGFILPASCLIVGWCVLSSPLVEQLPRLFPLSWVSMVTPLDYSILYLRHTQGILHVCM